jgi:hypothetical protein
MITTRMWPSFNGEKEKRVRVAKGSSLTMETRWDLGTLNPALRPLTRTDWTSGPLGGVDRSLMVIGRVACRVASMTKTQ